MRVSSRATVFNKRVFPVIWLGGVVFFIVTVITSHFTGGPKPAPWFMLPLPIAMLIFGYRFFNRLFFSLADEVREEKGHLIVRKGGIEEKIPFANIGEIDYQYLSNPRITLHLKVPGKLGNAVTFMPLQHWTLFEKDPRMVELIARIRSSRWEIDQ